MSWVCGTCGEPHEGQPTDAAFKLPDVVFAIPKDEREARAKFDSDFCMFEGRHFIRCVLALPFAGTEGYFGYGAWAEVDRATFDRYRDISFRDASPDPPGNGTIANRFSSYPKA